MMMNDEGEALASTENLDVEVETVLLDKEESPPDDQCVATERDLTKTPHKTPEETQHETFGTKDAELEGEAQGDSITPGSSPADRRPRSLPKRMPSLLDGSDDDESEEEEEKEEACDKAKGTKRRRHTMAAPMVETPILEDQLSEQLNSPQRQERSTEGLDLMGADTPPVKNTRGNRKRRHTISTSSTFRTEHPKEVWDKFVRKGARLKTFVDDALQLVAKGFATKTPKTAAGSKRPLSAINGESPTQDGPIRRRLVDEHAADLAREKTTEVMILKRKLKEAEAHAAAMTAANATLREAQSASAERMERTAEALRIASTNAANSRADADAAEACSASLGAQLQSLKSVVEETKRASQVLYEEHEQVSEAARSVEARLVQRESENFRMQKEQRRMMEEREELMKKAASLDKQRQSLETKLNEHMEELAVTKRTAEEREAVEQARNDRSHLIDRELRETRAMLVESTAAAAETESTTALLNETIQELQRENKSLHERMEQTQDRCRKENERLNDALQKAEGKAQKLRIKAAADEEEVQRLRLDRGSNEKEIAQLKSRITNLERRLKESTTVSPAPLVEKPSEQQSDELGTKRNVAFSIPPLRSTSPKTPGSSGKENTSQNGSAKKPSGKCCLCYKDAFGLMKSCQCGKKDCDKRAHASCVAGSTAHAAPSVSHPGTPAPKLPVVLCGSIRT